MINNCQHQNNLNHYLVRVLFRDMIVTGTNSYQANKYNYALDVKSGKCCVALQMMIIQKFSLIEVKTLLNNQTLSYRK